MATCPCCSDTLLRQLSAGKLYLLCQSCKIQLPAEEFSEPLEEAMSLYSFNPLSHSQKSQAAILKV